MSKQGYPKTILDFTTQFPNDEVCLKYLIQNRWPDGFVCPTCQQSGGWWLEKYQRFECKKCHRHISPLSGTLMHRSHLPIHIWFWAAYLMTTHTPGISAVQLQRQLGISKVDSAWFLLHRLRQGMVRTDREPLKGVVEADETHVGGPAKGRKGRGVREAATKTLVAGAVEIVSFQNKKGELEEKAGRVRMEILRSADGENIGKFLKKNVATGSTVKSDGWKGYSEKALKGYNHISQIQGSPEHAKELAPHIHRVFSNLKSWLIGIHHGVEPKYLQSYLDEFVFRFNRRAYPMSAFRSLLEIVTRKAPLTLKNLTQP